MELLVPAGSLPVLRTAVRYGADAVYIGGEAFSLRQSARNFNPEDMKEGVAYAHAQGVRVYVTANILAHNADLSEAAAYFTWLSELAPDGLLIADPGMFRLARTYAPQIPIHISTQANNTNYETCLFWYEQGVRRIVLARELSLSEIRDIHSKVPKDLELEAFVHGAMCMAYSGRCLLSNVLTGRDANGGACTHPCRWEYELCAQVEEKTRPGEKIDIMENARGTFVFNAKDLCMIRYMRELKDAGISSLKIEGRMKTALYVATTTRAYRMAIDLCEADPERYEAEKDALFAAVTEGTVRPFSTGFYFGKPGTEAQILGESTYEKNAVYLGTVEEIDAHGRAVIFQKNKFACGDEIVIMKPRVRGLSETEQIGEWDVPAVVTDLFDAEGTAIPDAPHPKMELHVSLDPAPEIGDVLKKYPQTY